MDLGGNKVCALGCESPSLGMTVVDRGEAGGTGDAGGGGDVDRARLLFPWVGLKKLSSDIRRFYRAQSGDESVYESYDSNATLVLWWECHDEGMGKMRSGGEREGLVRTQTDMVRLVVEK